MLSLRAGLRLFSAAYLFLALASFARADEKVTVAMLPSPTNAPFRVALDAGSFKDYGLEVVPVQFNGGTQTIMALMSGDVHLTTTGEYIRNHRDQVKRFMMGYIAGLARLKGDRMEELEHEGFLASVYK